MKATLISLLLITATLSGQQQRPPRKFPIPPHAAVPTFQTIDYPGAGRTAALGIDDVGDIVGWYQAFLGDNPHGFVSHNGQFTTIDHPAGTMGTEVTAINNNQQMAGVYADTTSHGFFWDNGVFTSIDGPNAISTTVCGINDYGQVVGFFVDAKGLHGLVWDHWILTPFDVTGAANTEIHGINNQGQFVGVNFNADGITHGFIWDRGAVSTMDGPGGLDQIEDLHAINDQRLIVGEVLVNVLSPHPVPLPPNTPHGVMGFTMTSQSFTLIQIPGSKDSLTVGVNNLGRIVGLYDDDTGEHGFVY